VTSEPFEYSGACHSTTINYKIHIYATCRLQTATASTKNNNTSNSNSNHEYETTVPAASFEAQLCPRRNCYYAEGPASCQYEKCENLQPCTSPLYMISKNGPRTVEAFLNKTRTCYVNTRDDRFVYFSQADKNLCIATECIISTVVGIVPSMVLCVLVTCRFSYKMVQLCQKHCCKAAQEKARKKKQEQYYLQYGYSPRKQNNRSSRNSTDSNDSNKSGNYKSTSKWEQTHL